METPTVPNMELLHSMWKQYDPYTYILIINGLQVASVQPGNDSPYCIYAYDSDWQQVFIDHLGSDIIDDFDTAEIAMKSAELVFIGWLYKTCNDFKLLKQNK